MNGDKNLEKILVVVQYFSFYFINFQNVPSKIVASSMI